MSKIEQIRSEMVAAMKARDKDRKDALSMLLGSLKNKAIDKRSDLTEAEENDIVLKEIKRPWSPRRQTVRILLSSAGSGFRSTKNLHQSL